MGQMNLFLRLILVFAVAGLPALAQEARPVATEIGTSGQAYDAAIRLRGIDAEVQFFDPDRPAPPLETRASPPPPALDAETREGQERTTRTTITLIAAAVLGLIGYLLVRYGGRMNLSLRTAAANPARTPTRPVDGDATAPAIIRGLAEIRGMTDRRAALMALAQKALAAAVSDNGVILQRSWTLREAMAHVPTGQRHRDALNALVMDSEGVHFGGRDVTEDQFTAHLSAILPMLEGARG